MAETTSILELLIRAKNEAGGVLKDIRKDLLDVGDKAKGATKGLSDLKQPQTLDAVNKLSSGILSLAGTARTLVSAFLAFEAVKFVKGLADTAARTETLGTVLKVVAGNAGISSKEIDNLDKKVQSLGITAASSRQSLVQLIQSGLVEGGAKFAEGALKAEQLARAAQNLAVISGQNSSETFSRLIINIQQMDVVGLRFLGIMVQREAAQEEFAKSLNKTATSLTLAEQKQAFLNAVLREAVKLEGTYEEAMADVGKQLTSLPRLIEALKVSIGNVLLPAYSALVSEFSILLKQLGLYSNELSGKATPASIQLGEVVRGLARGIREVIVEAIKLRDLLAGVFSVVGGLAFVSLISKITGLLAGVSVAASSVGAIFTTIWASIGVIVTGLVGPMTALRLGFALLVSALRLGASAVAAFFVGWEIGTFLRQFDVVREFADSVVARIGYMVNFVISSIETVIIGARASWVSFLAFIGAISEAEKKASEVELTKELAEIERRRQVARELLDDATNVGLVKKTAKEIEDLISKQLDLVGALDIAKQQLADLRKRGAAENSAQIQDLLLTIKQLEEKKKDLDKQITDVKKTAEPDVVVRVETRVEKGKIQSEFTKVKDDFEDAKKRAGLDKFTFIEGQTLSQEFSSINSAFNSLYERFMKPKLFLIGKDVNVIALQFKELLQTLLLLEERARTVDDFNRLIEVSNTLLSILPERAKGVAETAVFNRQKVEVEELNKRLDGAIKGLEGIKKASELVRDVQVDQIKSSGNLRDIYLELGVSTGRATGGIISLAQTFDTLFNSVSTLEKAKISDIKAQENVIKSRYETEIKILDTLTDRKKREAKESSTSTIELNNSLVAIDKSAIEERLSLQKRYFDGLKGLQAEALSRYQSLTNSIKSLDKEVANLIRSQDSDVRELRRKGLTDVEQYADRQQELNLLVSQQREALDNKDYELARELGQKRIALSKDLANAPEGIDKQKALDLAVNETTSAYQSQIDIVKQQRTEAQQAAEAQGRLIKELTESLNSLSATISATATEQIIKIKADLDSESANAVLSTLKDMFGNIVATIKPVVQAVGETTGFAGGGLVNAPGPRGTDSRLAWIGDYEYVMNHRAVEKYGVGFMNLLNSLSFEAPHFAEGGLNTNGMVQANLNFPNFGSFVMFGAKGEVERLNDRLDKESLKVGGRSRK